MIQHPFPKTWSDRLAGWENALDTKWKHWAERAFVWLTRAATWTYVLVVVLVYLVLHWAGDEWWAASLLLFGPRWLGLLPLLVLVPMAVVLRRRLLIPLAGVSVLFVFGVLGFCMPLRWRAFAVDSEKTVSLLTCNVQGGECRWDQVWQLIQQESPDIVALQEFGADEELLLPDDWHSVREKGLLIASPHPISEVQVCYRHEPPAKWPPLMALYAVIDIPERRTCVCNIHLTSPHHGLTEVLDRHTIVSLDRTGTLTQLNEIRRQESETTSAWLRKLPQVDILMGDFNLPVESRIYRQSWSSYRNVFSEIGFGVGYTRWVTLHNFQYGVRIDHILTGENWAPVRCSIGRDIGSDHMPIVAEVSRP